MTDQAPRDLSRCVKRVLVPRGGGLDIEMLRKRHSLPDLRGVERYDDDASHCTVYMVRSEVFDATPAGDLVPLLDDLR